MMWARIGLFAGVMVALAVTGAVPVARAAEPVYDIAYGDHERQRLDVFPPASDDVAPGQAGPEGAGRAIVLFFHGGAWRAGSKDRLRFVGHTLAGRGYLAVSANYRLYPEVRFPTFMTDAAAAVAWVRKNSGRWGGDPDRIYLMGHSAGAHIAALLALDPGHLKRAGVPRAAVRGAVGLAGPYAFDPMGVSWIRPIFEAHPKGARPISFAGNTGPRLLLLHGGRDRLIAVSDPRRMARAYRKAGGAVRLEVYPALNHVGVLLALAPGFREASSLLDDVTAFLGKP